MRFSGVQIRVLVVLALVNFVNYIDRQIIYPLFPLIRDEFTLSYLQVGALAAAFSIVHSLATLPFGVVADRTSRRKVISFGLFFWSAATFTSGLAGSFRALVPIRAAVGIGEAAYAPAATAIITGSFPREVRARVQGIFDTGMFLGGALGLALGGIIGEALGWRPAFFLVGIPGLLLGLAIFQIPEPPRVQEKRIPVSSLLRNRAYLLLLIAGCFITFAGHAYVIWGTEFVHRYKGFTLREAGVSLGLLTVIAGLLGVTCGAAFSDFLAKRVVWGRIAIVPIGFLTSAPFILLALRLPAKNAVLGLFFLGVFFATWYHGPVSATIHDLTPPDAHATAMGLYYFVVNLLATSAAPLVVGGIGDRFSLLAGMHVAVAAQIAGALGFIGVGALIARRGLHGTDLGPSPLTGLPLAAACTGPEIAAECRQGSVPNDCATEVLP